MTEKEELELYREFLLYIWDGTDFYNLVGQGELIEEELALEDETLEDWQRDMHRCTIEEIKEGRALVDKVEKSLMDYLLKNK